MLTMVAPSKRTFQNFIAFYEFFSLHLISFIMSIKVQSNPCQKKLKSKIGVLASHFFLYSLMIPLIDNVKYSF